MGDPLEMEKWTHVVLVNGEPHRVGTEIDCRKEARRLVEDEKVNADSVEVLLNDGIATLE
jgi:hypothetical protein